MQFQEIINAKLSKETDRPLMQKDAYPVSAGLQRYLQQNGRGIALPVSYSDLLYYSHTNALRDKKGKLTHWETAVYDTNVQGRLNLLLLKTFAILKKQAVNHFINDHQIERIDFCEFGNSIPFRIVVLNKPRGIRDRFYVKLADASRIYGLELEHLLSPDNTNFLYHNNTLVEEHIEGMPGDLFLKQHLQTEDIAHLLFAKEFVQFNERCFARLLGDMRSYNFVIVPIAGHATAFRIRAIDFDQQSYEGKKSLYLPQFYKENFAFVEMVLKELTTEEIAQAQAAERTRMKERVKSNKKRLMELLNAMTRDELSETYKVQLLRNELNAHFKTSAFSSCKTMGAMVKRQLKQVLL